MEPPWLVTLSVDPLCDFVTLDPLWSVLVLLNPSRGSFAAAAVACDLRLLSWLQVELSPVSLVPLVIVHLPGNSFTRLDPLLAPLSLVPSRGSFAVSAVACAFRLPSQLSLEPLSAPLVPLGVLSPMDTLFGTLPPAVSVELTISSLEQTPIAVCKTLQL